MEIRELVQQRLPLLTKLRQELHKIPEQSCQEFLTQAYICDFLAARGILFRKIETGVEADFSAQNPHARRIAFRADIDALPILEKTPVPYRSSNGCMHACGHDGHTAMLLTLCDILAESNPACHVRAIFQFGEEGQGGAETMIAKGAIDDVDKIFALHVDPSLSAGEFATRIGGMMAGAVEFNVTFFGKSAHCAEPQKGIDALKAAADFVASLASFALADTLIHAGKLTGGTARNVIADKCEILATLRYFDEPSRAKVMDAIAAYLDKLDKQFGTTHALNIASVYPPLVNTAAAEAVVRAVCDTLGDAPRRYTAEDFAFYTQKIDGCMTWIGVDTGEFNAPLHADTFGFCEQPLLGGVELFLRLIDHHKEHSS